jgi:SAM-dependent methyltransferase
MRPRRTYVGLACDSLHGLMSAREAFKAFEAAGWGARATSYERLIGPLTAGTIPALLDAAGVGAGVRVLDVGTGTGEVAAAALERGAVPIGLDLAKEMIAAARARHPEIEFRQGDAEEMPFTEGAFDAVLAAFVLNHLPHPEAAAAEWSRVLRPSGRLALSIWEEPRRSPFFGVLMEAMRAAGIDGRSRIPSGPDPYRFADDREMRSLLEAAGFEQVTVSLLELSFRATDVRELVRGVLEGTVRAAGALEAATDAELARFETELARASARYHDDQGLKLPALVKVASARRG